ncbi:MAG: ABC transporter permease [Tannerellaceae bacterium]|jgi:ABC-type antimicrobial peptide transport system permease subunit|nr:ABC transporter permease [Tannerellaceae bacterium]
MKKKWAQHIKSALYTIRKNKAYALFCISGTAFTFIFVVFLAQLAFTALSNYPPSIHADRTIVVSHFTDNNGKNIGGLSRLEIDFLLQDIKEYTSYSIINQGTVNALINDRFRIFSVAYVNTEFWEMNSYRFIAGRPFTKEECDARKNGVIITKNLAKSYFRSLDVVGRKIEVRGADFEILGVVDDFSFISSPTGASEIWFPYTFYPFSNNPFTLHVFFSQPTAMQQAKEMVGKAVEQSFSKKNVSVYTGNLSTVKEQRIGQSGDSVLGFGIGTLILLLLLIPAINILTLKLAYTRNRAEEIAIRRTFGAGKLSSFFQLLLEDLLLVMAGALIGIIATKPAVSMIQRTFFDIPMLGSASLISGVDFFIIAGVIVPLMLLFLFMFGGIPAYLTAKRNIADVLKGGMR